MEKWRDIIGYEGLYLISSKGKVRGVKRNSLRLTPIDVNGYRMISLCKNSVTAPFRIHRLVALHFVDNPNTLPVINHIDEDKLNNNADNLEWCTTTYNNQYSAKKLNKEKVAEIRKLISLGISQSDIAGAYNVNPSTVSRVGHGLRWR